VSLSSSALTPCCSVCHPRRFSTTVVQAEKLLGVTARELFEMRSTDNQAGYDKVFADCLFKPIIAKVRTTVYVQLSSVVRSAVTVKGAYTP
jgi:hypothetical protein